MRIRARESREEGGASGESKEEGGAGLDSGASGAGAGADIVMGGGVTFVVTWDDGDQEDRVKTEAQVRAIRVKGRKRHEPTRFSGDDAPQSSQSRKGRASCALCKHTQCSLGCPRRVNTGQDAASDAVVLCRKSRTGAVKECMTLS